VVPNLISKIRNVTWNHKEQSRN